MQFINLETIKISVKNGSTKEIEKLTINNPPVNSLSIQVLKEINEAIDILTNKNCPLVIITGNGEKSFVAGANIAEMKNFNKDEAYSFSKIGNDLFQKLELSPIISIAALNGFTLGGGFELALATDIRLASEKAILGLPEVTLGLIPGFGGTQKLSRLIGEGRAKYYTLSGKTITAKEAESMGIVQKVCTPESLLNECIDLAKVILSNGPIAIQTAKNLVHNSLSSSLAKGIDNEINQFANLFTLEQTQEGLSAFLEKRSANF